MKHRIALTAILLAALTATAHAGGPEVHGCDFKIKARCANGDARVTLADGKVTRIEVDVFWCGLHGRPGYTCLIDSSRGEADAKWSDDGDATLIDNASPFNANAPDRVRVTIGQDVTIDLAETQSLGRCGAGAELPRTIVIPAKKRMCRVQLGEP